MKKTIIMAAVLVAMVGCNKSIIESPVADSDYGYINLGVTAETEMVLTKGITTEADLTGYKINLTKDEVQVAGWPKDYSNSIDWKVPAGNYTVMVYDKARVGNDSELSDVYTSNDDKGDKYIYGSADVTVVAGETAECEVNCTVQNSKISFAYDSKFDAIFTKGDFEVVDEINEREASPVIESAHQEANAVYFEPVTLTWTLRATPKLGGVEKTYTGEVVLEKAKWSQVTFSSGNTDGQIDVEITVDGSMTVVTVSPIELDPTQEN